MKSVHLQSYKKLLKYLTSKRLLLGVTQLDLSSLLNKPQSFVSKYENGERRLDIIEAIEICNALKINPHELIDEIQGYEDEH